MKTKPKKKKIKEEALENYSVENTYEEVPMPDRYYVGNYKYSVDYHSSYVNKTVMEETSNYTGIVNPDTLRIDISTIPPVSKQLLVLLHECAHAFCVDVLNKNIIAINEAGHDEQEEFMDNMASFCLDLILKNPQIVEKIYDVFIEEE